MPNNRSARRREEKKQKRAEEAAKRRPLANSPARAVVTYTDPNGLIVVGPVLTGRWMVPNALKERLEQAGRPVPPPVAGYFLVDTGASMLCIAEDVTRELNLRPVGIGESYGAHGKHTHEVFHASLQIEFNDKGGLQHSIHSEGRVSSVRDLGDHWKGSQFDLAANYPKRLIGLLGRDFLRHAVLTYDGARGFVEIVMDIGSLPRTPQSKN